MKALLILLLMLLWVTGRVVGDPSINGLGKSVSDFYPYNGFHEAVGQIEKNTGFRVSYPKELDAFMNGNLWWSGKHLAHHTVSQKYRHCGPEWAC